MCFFDEPAWIASVSTEDVLTAARPVRCDECRREIPAGGWVRHIWRQEHEVCRHNPQHEDYEGPETDSEECPEGCEHDHGGTFDYDCCEACDHLIEAIRRHELDEGCDEYDSMPLLTELYAAMHDGQGPAYLAQAEALYPGITARLPESFVKFREGD